MESVGGWLAVSCVCNKAGSTMMQAYTKERKGYKLSVMVEICKKCTNFMFE